MADISAELEVIENERRGALVKQAIHDALDKLNQTANRRPTAKTGVPIGEVIIDTGWVEGSLVGSLIAGEIHTFDGVIENSAYEPSGAENTLRLFANHDGKAYIVTTSEWRTEGDIYPTITDSSGLTWTLERSFKGQANAYDANNSDLSTYVTNPTIKGYVYDASELPEADANTVGDVYVDNVNHITYYGAEDNGVYSWGMITDPVPSGLCHNARSDRICVWSATVTESADIVAVIADSGTYLSSAVFAVYNTSQNRFSEYDTHVAVPMQRGRGYWVSTFAGKVATPADLPSEPTSELALFYVESNDSCYEYSDGDWINLAQNVFDGSIDSKTYAGAIEGITANTAKIFVTSAYYENQSYIPHLVLSDSSMASHVQQAVSTKAGGSKISAWFQESGLSTYPRFKPAMGTEDYLNLHDHSFVIFEIELIPHVEGSDS